MTQVKFPVMLDKERAKYVTREIAYEQTIKELRLQLEQAHADIAGLHDQLEEPQIAQDDYRLNKLELEQLRQQLADTEEKRADLEFVWNGCEQDLENCKAERDQLRQQLTSRDAEIERLKTVPMRYRRMAFNAQLQDENAQLYQQLADRNAELKRINLAIKDDRVDLTITAAEAITELRQLCEKPYSLQSNAYIQG